MNAEGPTGKSRQATILLADDFILLREGLAAICELSGGYEVVAQCTDGRCALESMVRLKPELAVVDFKLPELFALELIAELQRIEIGTKVLVMANQRDRKVAVEVLRAGGRGVLLESDTSKEVLLALEQVMAGGIYLSPTFSLSDVFASNVPAPETGDPLDRLSSREYQVYSLLVEGVRAKEIAARLSLSPKTVDTYRASLMKKLDIHHVPGLVRFAMDRELRSPGEQHPPERAVAADMLRLSEHVGAGDTTFVRSADTDRSEPPHAPEPTRKALSAASGEGISNRTPGNWNLSHLSR